MARSPNPFVGDIIGLSISAIESWRRCHRLYRSKHLLRLPERDRPRDSGIGLGLLVHCALHDIHTSGSCRDDNLVEGVLETLSPGHGHALRPYVDCHRQRCPDSPDWQSHEHELARFHRLPPPMWMLTGKIDALWLRGGVLSARDYKTGSVYSDRVGDDFAARTQAWLLAPLASRLGARLRITYEHLAARPDEWPQPYEPEDDDIAAAGEAVVHVATEIANEVAFDGIGESWACGGCGYASICPDAHARKTTPLPPGAAALRTAN